MKYLIFIPLLLLCNSCNYYQIVDPDEQPGGITISIDKSNIPSNITSIKATLSREGFENITSQINVDNNSGSIIFKTIPEGNWHLFVEAKDINDSTYLSSAKIIKIVSGLITPVTMILTSANSFGGLYLFVSWEYQSEWQDFAGNPLTHNGLQTFIIYENNKFKMWFTAINIGIKYAESNDGFNWKIWDKPAITYGDYPFETREISIGYVYKTKTKYIAFYQASNNSGITHICRAESFDGINWQKDSKPLLTETTGGWNNISFHATSLIMIDDIYHLYLKGRNVNNDASIRVATSSDGRNFKVLNKPILVATQDWEGSSVGWARVSKKNDKYVMLYAGGDIQRGNNNRGFSYAESDDGINWIKPGNKPFFIQSQTAQRYDWIDYPFIISANGFEYLYYTGRAFEKEFTLCVAIK